MGKLIGLEINTKKNFKWENLVLAVGPEQITPKYIYVFENMLE